LTAYDDDDVDVPRALIPIPDYLQDMQQAIIYGGCQICNGDTIREDPSGSDELSIRYLDISNIFVDPGSPRGLNATWSIIAVDGYAPMPPRKGHDVVVSGCGSDRLNSFPASVQELSQTISQCTLFCFGGWNPRWQGLDRSHNALLKFDAILWTWSAVPSDKKLVRVPLLTLQYMAVLFLQCYLCCCA
jgi:hypothetical protein